MAISAERLRQTFSVGGAQDIYQAAKCEDGFLHFARSFVFDEDCRVSRSALWGLTKASNDELSELQPILGELMQLAMQTENSSVRRLTLSVIERMRISEDNLRTDFLDFCLEHTIRMDESSGTQALCLKLAFRMCKFYPELMDELRRTLETMEIDCYRPAVRGVRNRIIRGKLK